jgi:hypothetical protein
MAETEIGCIAYAKQAFSIPSDLVEAGIGCIACARQAIDIPSDLVETEIGCIVSARQARKVPGRPEKPHFSIPAIYKSIPHFKTAML